MALGAKLNILFIMIPITLVISLGFLVSFIWVVTDGQYDDVETPAYRMLEDEKNSKEDGV